jgi:hypothetical protein
MRIIRDAKWQLQLLAGSSMYVVKLTGLIILFKNNLLQDAIEKLLRFI